MVRIRLRRTGLKQQPTYRIVAADKESPRDGRFIEILGSYNPRTEPFTLELNEDRVFHWMSVGAQPSESVVQLFKSAGVMARFERIKAGEAKDTVVEEGKVALAARSAKK
jgi:small subunit ribosomal protein S16